MRPACAGDWQKPQSGILLDCGKGVLMVLDQQAAASRGPTIRQRSEETPCSASRSWAWPFWRYSRSSPSTRVSVSATGDEFFASKAGKTKGKETRQTEVSKQALARSNARNHPGLATIKARSSATHKEVLPSTVCAALARRKISAAHFEFSAEGSAKLEKPSPIVADEGLRCELLIEPQTVEAPHIRKHPGK